MIKAVLFDVGGVIKTNYPLSKDTAEICGVSDEKVKEIKEERRLKVGIPAEKGLISDEDFWVGVSEILGKKLPQTPEECVKIAKKRYIENFVFHQEVVDLAKELKEKGIKIAILSNVFEYSAEVIRQKGGYDNFDPVILSYEVGMAKPEKDIYLYALRKLNLKPEECIFIDDKEENLVPARELGMKTVLAENQEQIVKDVWSIIDIDNSL